MFLEHVNLTVSDLDRSIEFYTRLLGYHVRWQGTLSDGKRAAHVGDERNYLALFEAPRSGRASLDYDQVGLNHFGFVVDDLQVLRDRLETLDTTPSFEPDYEPGRRFYFLDPDGIEIELVQYETSESPTS